MKTVKHAHLSELYVRRFWAKVALPDENDCMLWLASRFSNGYGQFMASSAHRFSLLIGEGQPPCTGMQAAHSCRNRHCVAPTHLRWATRLENEADKLADGTRNWGTRNGQSKLTSSQVLEIKTRYASRDITQYDLAAQYGVSQTTVHQIVTGSHWGWLV